MFIFVFIYRNVYNETRSFVTLNVILIYLHIRPACSILGHFDTCILYGKGFFKFIVFQFLRAFKFNKRTEIR